MSTVETAFQAYEEARTQAWVAYEEAREETSVADL